jgi:hypothetical protein
MGIVHGVVTDPSGAVIAGARVALIPDAGDEPAADARTNEAGIYALSAAAGIYRIAVEAPGFAKFEGEPVAVGTSEVSDRLDAGRTINVMLKLPVQMERIDVAGETEPAGSVAGGGVLLTRREVQQMPLDPAALLDELLGMAGGPGAELYVGGFSGGTLPSRDSIASVRIRHSAFSAENDIDPANGIIQVSTRPGTGALHGEMYVYGDDSGLNAGNPFAPGQPGYYAYGTGGTLSGPWRRKVTYFAGWDQLQLAMNSAVNAQILDAGLNQVTVSDAEASPRSDISGSSRLDLQPWTNSTLMLRYGFDRNTQSNGGVGQLALASQGFNSNTMTQTFRVANTQLFGARVVNETRFQYIRMHATQTPEVIGPTILVEGSFLGGGNNLGPYSNGQDRFELQNYVSVAQGHHYVEAGARLRVGREASESQANYQGEFVFSSLAAYQATEVGAAAGKSFSQIAASGGGAIQYNLNTGPAGAALSLADAAAFIQDDWKTLPNLTLSYGLRFETQTYIADHADWAPRIGFSWGVGRGNSKGTTNYVIRGGVGVFYRRFGLESALRVQRQNGAGQQELIVANPQFCPPGPTIFGGCGGAPTAVTLASTAAQPAVFSVSPQFHAPYYIAESVGVDRRFGRAGTAGLTYMNSRGVHTQLLENVNAPLAGTYDAANPASGTRPFGASGDDYQFESGGVFRSQRLTANLAVRTRHASIFATYVLRFDHSDSEGDGTFPMDNRNLRADYARSLDDVRHTFTLGESATLPFGIQTSGYLRALSGAPFNIVVGSDLNGDTQFNDRPSFATDLTRPSVVSTAWGTFDAAPIAGQTIIPRNYGQGPGQFVVNLAAGRSIPLGPKRVETDGTPGGKTRRKYALEMWVQSQNLLNHPNLTSPVNILGSPLFGRSMGLTGASELSPDRVLDLQLSIRL